MKQHESIKLTECSEGVQLAEAVIDEKGMLLVAEGTILNDKLIQRLVSKNIDTICVMVDEQISDEEKNLRRQQLEEQITKRFRKVISEPLMLAFRDALINYRSEDL